MTPAGRASDQRKRAGSGYLDGYEKFVGRVIAAQQRLAKQSKNHALRSIVETQAGLTRQVHPRTTQRLGS